MDGYDDPARTLELLRTLTACGLPDSAFALLHHFKKPETVARHRAYCEDLAEEGGRFSTNTNRLVQRRLELVLKLYQAGQFSSHSPELFESLARAALAEFPHDTRPLHEQYVENKRGAGNAD